MLLTSNRKTIPALFALSVLLLAGLLQSFWGWQANKAVQNEHGVFNYPLAFLPADTDELTSTESAYSTALERYLTRQFLKIVYFFGMERHPIDFINAREADLDYHVNGFSLIESPMEESDWSIQENREKFYSEMEPIIRKLHPDIAEFFWFDEAFLQRYVNGNNEPALDFAHLDYHPDQSLSMAWAGYNVSDFDMILGLWKPDNMDTPVVDYPLALVDGSTFGPEEAIPFYGQAEQTLMDGSSEVRRFTASALRYSPKHKFYYYPDQTSNEVLLFRQYTNEKTMGAFANPHTSFKVPNFPRGAPSRRSVEMRVGISFKQDDAKTSTGVYEQYLRRSKFGGFGSE